MAGFVSGSRSAGRMAVVMLVAMPCLAATRYVSLDGHAVSPYTSWYNAATNLPQCVAAAVNGDTILVSNGVYHVTNTCVLNTSNKVVTITSLSGRDLTILDGGGQAMPGPWSYCF